MCFRGGKAPTRRNLGAASLFSFVMVAKVRSINAFISLETTTETNLPAKNVQRFYANVTERSGPRAGGGLSRHAGRNNHDGLDLRLS